MLAFYAIARDGDIEGGVEKLENLINLIEEKEGRNANLL